MNKNQDEFIKWYETHYHDEKTKFDLMWTAWKEATKLAEKKHKAKQKRLEKKGGSW